MYYVYVDRPTGEVSSCYSKRQESWQKLGTEYSFERIFEAKSFIYDELFRYNEIEDYDLKVKWVNKNVDFRMEWVDERNPEKDEIKMRICLLANRLLRHKNIKGYKVHPPLQEFLSLAVSKAFTGFTVFPELDRLSSEANHLGRYSGDSDSCWLAYGSLDFFITGLSPDDFYRLEEIMYLLYALHGNNAPCDVVRWKEKADSMSWEKPTIESWELPGNEIEAW